MNRLLLLTIGIAWACAASAQSYESYMKSRKQFGITQASTPAALSSFVGQKVIEVRGIVRGFLEVEGKQLLVIEDPQSSREVFVSALAAPDWLKNGNTVARMIVRASRESDISPLAADLVIACADEPVTAYDEALAKKEAAKLASKTVSGPSSRRSSTGRPGRLPGSFPSITGNVKTGTPGLSADILAVLPAYTAFIQNHNKKLSYDKAQEIAAHLLRFAVQYGVDARLIVALIICESDFDPNETSRVGAQGLGQLMPGTARGLGVTNSYDTEQNLYGTIKLLRGNLDKYSAKVGDDYEALVLALAAYNAGGGAVAKYGGVPPYRETQNYVKKVIATYKRLIGQP